jgi:hypothetical protein
MSTSAKLPGVAVLTASTYKLDVWPNVRPLLLAKHDDCNCPGRKVLLISHVLVGRQKQIEPGLFRCRQQFAVLQFVPALLKRRTHRVPS